MLEKIDKRDRADLFRKRLIKAMAEVGTTQSALARAIGVDRSTISQLVKSDGPRLPNAHVVGAVASALGVSADWLLSLSDRPESAADLMSAGLSLTAAPRALVDQQIFDWHREAAGYKIRHVPAALPDMLKTQSFLEWEYTPHLGRTARQAIGASSDRLTWMRSARSDYEIAMPSHELLNFAHAQGYYRGLPLHIRLEQIDYFRVLVDQLYPRLRIYQFEARRLYSAPVTIFGPLICVFYAGGHYLAFRDRERIDTFTAHFDNLIKEATITSRDLPGILVDLRSEIA